MYNDTKVKISIPFHEDLFLRSSLSIDMWTEDYYELLELIGDDYEWTKQTSSLQSSGALAYLPRSRCTHAQTK